MEVRFIRRHRPAHVAGRAPISPPLGAPTVAQRQWVTGPAGEISRLSPSTACRRGRGGALDRGSVTHAWRNRPDETPLGILTYGENPRRLAFPATQQHGPRTKTRV